MSKTVSWDEDILQADGRVFSVHRTATYAPDEWGRSGHGNLKGQTIHFVRNGQKFTWKDNDRWLIARMPEILDFANDMPVVILPVHRWGPCEKYGFPQEGLVAFGYRNGQWDRIALSDVPKELKVNLLRSTHEIRYWDEYKGKRVTVAIKQQLDPNNGYVTKQGQSLAEAIKLHATTDEPCVLIHPLPNPPLEALKQQNAEAETRAKTLVATVTSSSDVPETISAGDYRKVKGAAVKYLAESCKGVVGQIGQMRQYSNRGWALLGYTVVLRDGNHIPIPQPNLKFAQAVDPLELVTCDKTLIYTVKRQSSDQLIIHRFSHSGALQDVLRITLPDVAQVFPKGKWPTLWEAVPENGNLGSSLASYSYRGTPNEGGLIEQRLNYTIQLPR